MDLCIDWIQLARVENNQPKKLTKILEYEYDYICRPKQLENLGLFQFRSFWSKRKIPKENTKKAKHEHRLRYLRFLNTHPELNSHEIVEHEIPLILVPATFSPFKSNELLLVSVD